MRLFGYPYNNDLVICKDSPGYLISGKIQLLKLCGFALQFAVHFYRVANQFVHRK